MVRVKVAPKVGEGIIYFDLRESDIPNTIELVAVDSSGALIQGGRILSIDGDGTITRQRGVNPELGLPLDDGKRVKDYHTEKFMDGMLSGINNMFRNY